VKQQLHQCPEAIVSVAAELRFEAAQQLKFRLPEKEEVEIKASIRDGEHFVP